MKDTAGNVTGYHTRTCKRCGETETASCVYGSYISNDDGTHHRTCPDCGGVETQTCSFPPPTVVDGKNHFECSRCGYSYDEEIPTEPAPTDPTTP